MSEIKMPFLTLTLSAGEFAIITSTGSRGLPASLYDHRRMVSMMSIEEITGVLRSLHALTLESAKFQYY